MAKQFGILALLLFAAVAGHCRPPRSGPERLVLTADPYVNSDIYVVNADGSGQANLTRSPEWEHCPRWSPDGRRIVFFANEGWNPTFSPGRGEAAAVGTLCTISPDGTNQVRLTDKLVTDRDCAISPDGSCIAVLRIRFHPEDVLAPAEGTGQSVRKLLGRLGVYRAGTGIYLINSDGGNKTLLLPDVHGFARPRWSPDGTKIAFFSSRAGVPTLNLVNVDATAVSSFPLDANAPPSPNTFLSWSPNGKRLLWTSTTDGNYGVSALDISSATVTRLTRVNENNYNPEWSPDGGRIAFISNRDNKPEIYVMDPDGASQIRLTKNLASVEVEFLPQWSPHGSQIAFLGESGEKAGRYGDFDWDVYVVRAETTGVTRLTDHGQVRSFPTWSPDGSRIAYFALGGVYVVNRDGSAQTRVADSGASASGSPRAVCWSPDGNRVAFAAGYIRNQKAAEYVANIEAKNRAWLTAGKGDNRNPVWSPDGSKLAFTSVIRRRKNPHPECACDEEIEDSDIFLMNPDGSSQVNLTRKPGDYQELAWSPHGKRIAFISHGKLYDIRPDGSNRRMLTHGTGSDGNLAWSSDGTAMGFVRGTREREAARYGLYRMKAGGSGLTRLADMPEGAGVAWSPDLSKVAFCGSLDLPGRWKHDLYVMNVDGSGKVKLAEDVSYEPPAWSPDGKSLAFVAGSEDKSQVYTIRSDGTDRRRLTADAGHDRSLVWSRDGKKIAFVGDFTVGNRWRMHLFVVDPDGSEQIQITYEGPAWLPAWSPDGKKIAFESDAGRGDGGTDICVVEWDWPTKVDRSLIPRDDHLPDSPS